MMDHKQQKQEIKRLSRALSQKDRALQREKRENARLKRQISALKGNYGHPLDAALLRPKKSYQSEANKEQSELIKTNTLNARRFSKKSYVRYLIQSVKESGVGLFFRRMTRFLRRLRLVRTVSAVVAAIVATLFLSAVFIAVLPFLLIFGHITLLAVFFRARAANRLMREKLKGKRVRVIIMPDSMTFRDDTFAERSAKAMANEPDVAVLVVSPQLFSSRGLGGHGMFFTVRAEAQDLYLVRRGYYFILRRRVLDTLDQEISIMY